MINRIHQADGNFGSQAKALKEQALDLTAVARERIQNGGRFLTDYTVQQPLKALGIALGAGVFLGWLIKRR